MSSITRPAPPDQRQREQALDAGRSILVQAPAGSGKTDLLTRRFLRLLSEVDEPGRIVAITFTKAAAAEMRNRILSELEKAAASGCADARRRRVLDGVPGPPRIAALARAGVGPAENAGAASHLDHRLLLL